LSILNQCSKFIGYPYKLFVFWEFPGPEKARKNPRLSRRHGNPVTRKLMAIAKCNDEENITPHKSKLMPPMR